MNTIKNLNDLLNGGTSNNRRGDVVKISDAGVHVRTQAGILITQRQPGDATNYQLDDSVTLDSDGRLLGRRSRSSPEVFIV